MLSRQKLEQLSRLDFAGLDKSQLVDMENIKMDTKLSEKDRVEAFLQRVQNPYCFRCGDIGIRLEFSTIHSVSLQKIMTDFLIRKRN